MNTCVALARILGFAAALGVISMADAPAAPVNLPRADSRAESAADAVGSSNTVTADPPVAVPDTAPVVVPLFKRFQFADFTPKPFLYTPPSGGPWAKIVLVGNFHVTPGIQYDRTSEITIGNVNVYYGTTPEPSRTFGPHWTFQRDLTDYQALLAQPQAGEAILGNLVNSTYTGVIYGSAALLFYPPDSKHPVPETANLVLPLPNAPGGAVGLGSASDVLSESFSLPTNVTRAYLDVFAQSQYQDEFWYSNVPSDLSSELFEYGNTAFRETEVTIDGSPAGVAPVYPWIYTGGIDPYLWFPIPGVQTLDFRPYRVDLTPFAGVLGDGSAHTVGVSVANDNNYFLVTGTLLVYTDPGASRVVGGVTMNTLAAAPNETVKEGIVTGAGGNIYGPVNTRASRDFVIAGYVDTSKGRVATQLRQKIDFSNDQEFYISAARYVQDISQLTTINTTVTAVTGGITYTHQRSSGYPLKLDYAEVVDSKGIAAIATKVEQSLDESNEWLTGSAPTFSDALSNVVSSQDTLYIDLNQGVITGNSGQSSSQRYTYLNSNGKVYERTLTAVDNALTSDVLVRYIP